MDTRQIFWIAMIFLAVAAVPLAIFHFTVGMTSPGKSLLKFFIDFAFFWFVIAIALNVIGLLPLLAVPAAFSIALIRHQKRPDRDSSSTSELDEQEVTDKVSDSTPR